MSEGCFQGIEYLMRLPSPLSSTRLRKLSRTLRVSKYNERFLLGREMKYFIEMFNWQATTIAVFTLANFHSSAQQLSVIKSCHFPFTLMTFIHTNHDVVYFLLPCRFKKMPEVLNSEGPMPPDEPDLSIFENKSGLAEDLKFLASMPELCDVTFLVGETREPVCAVKVNTQQHDVHFNHLTIAESSSELHKSRCFIAVGMSSTLKLYGRF